MAAQSHTTRPDTVGVAAVRSGVARAALRLPSRATCTAREQLPERFAVPCLPDNRQQVLDALEQAGACDFSLGYRGRATARRPRLAFVFTGQGQTGYALHALQLALVAQLQSWGIEADVALGHSLGEYGAAVTAGAMLPAESLRLVCERGRLMQALRSDGGMLVVRAAADALHEPLSRFAGLSVAAVNGPTSTVLAGRWEQLDVLAGVLAGMGMDSQALDVSHAFHSMLMEPMLPDFRTACLQLDFSPLHTPLISNLTGTRLPAGHVFDADHWVARSRAPVQFARSLDILAADEQTVLLEIGPRPTLCSLARSSGQFDDARLVPVLRGGGQELAGLLASAARLATIGMDVRLASVDTLRCMPQLPLYPFQRDTYWLETARREQAEPLSTVTALVSMRRRVRSLKRRLSALAT